MLHDDDVPAIFWRLLGTVSVLLLLLIVIGIALISAGFFDPKPLGDRRTTMPLDSLSVMPHSKRIEWLQVDYSMDVATLHLSASHLDGEVDTDYGILLGDEQSSLLVALSPLGYLTVATMESVSFGRGHPDPILPWQTWPHIRTDSETNEIWLDVRESNVISIRVNRELLLSEPIPVPGSGIGLWVESHGKSAIIRFEELEILSSD